MFDNKESISYGIDNSVWKAIEKAIEKNSYDSLFVLTTFLRKVYSESITHLSTQHFQKYIFFPASIYRLIYLYKDNNADLTKIQDFGFREIPLHLKEVISIDMNFNYRVVEDKVKFAACMGSFYYWAFNGFGRLLYFQIKFEDIKSFRNTINQLDQCSEEDSVSYYNLDTQFRIAKSNANNEREIDFLKHKINAGKAFRDYKRHTILGIKYWGIYLFKKDRIKTKKLERFLKFLNPQNNDASDLLKDILFFRSSAVIHYMGWQGWDYKDRVSGKSHTMPSPWQWLTEGFFVDQIRNNILYVNLEEIKGQDITQVKTLVESLSDCAKEIKRHFEKWQDILLTPTVEDFEEKSNKLLEAFRVVERKTIDFADRELAIVPLSPRRIKEFKDLVGKAWESHARINLIFKQFGNLAAIKDPKVELHKYGFRLFFEKGKKMFVDGSHYQTIYGMEQKGGQIGRGEDNQFFIDISKPEHQETSASSIVHLIEKSISQLKAKGIDPTLILMAPEYSYKDESLLNDPRFNPRAIIDPPQPFFELGSFDNIPIFSSYSDFLNNSILVCDFQKAFFKQYRQNKDWYNDELLVEVTKVSDDDAKSRFDSEPEKWSTNESGEKISPEDALTLIKTSVIIDIFTIIDYKILDADAYVIGKLR